MAELRSGVKWLLFLSSYIPLYLILIIKHRNITFTVPDLNVTVLSPLVGREIPYVSLFWLLLIVVSGSFLYLVLQLRQSKGGERFANIDSCRTRNDLVTNYILVYIFPFVVLDYTQTTNWLAFIIFFSVIGIIQVRSNHLYVNPVLAIFNYDIYEVDTGEEILTIVTKEDLAPSQKPVKTVELSNGVYLTV